MTRLREVEAILWDFEEQMQYWEHRDEKFQ